MVSTEIKRSIVKVVVFGAGVQGTVYGVRFARAGHEVTLIATPRRAAELRRFGAKIRHAETSETVSAHVTVEEELPCDCEADLCMVTVRREQLKDALVTMARAAHIERFVFLVNHANGSDDIFAAVGRARAVLAFPGIAGAGQGDAVGYVDVSQQPTVNEERAPEIADLFESASFPVDRVRDVDAWLKRHAVFITSIAGALYEKNCIAARLAEDHEAVRRFILAVREGWLEMDRAKVGSAPFALKFIFCHAPLWFSVRYWSKLLSSARGELYFAAHARHAPAEMAALASDVREFTNAGDSPELARLLDAIERWAQR
jgi:2-dehydropantoate 2-reductase